MTSDIDPDTEPDEAAQLTDGRSLRRRRNRDAVIRSLVELIRSGELNPTIEKIAERAQVSPRSIFRYFTDLDDLARTAIESEILRAMPLGMIPDRGEGDFPHRVDALLEARHRLFDAVHMLFVVAHRKADDIPDVSLGLETAAALLLEQLEYQFRDELTTLEPDDATALATSLSAALGLESWDLQIRYLDRTPEQVVQGWRLLLQRSLG